MALPASPIIQRAVQILQDVTSVRWPLDELVRWLNDGQREIVLYRPDSNPKVATGTLAAGTRQDLTAITGVSALFPAKLMDIVRNMASSSNKGSVRLCAREILDSQVPGWHAMPGNLNTVHYTFDERDPCAFYVYPPALGTTQLEIVFSAYPVDIAAPVDSVVVGSIGIKDIFANALLDYILYRAYSKDAEFAGNGARAQAHKAAFDGSMGVEVQGTTANSPNVNTTYNPNRPKRSA